MIIKQKSFLITIIICIGLFFVSGPILALDEGIGKLQNTGVNAGLVTEAGKTNPNIVLNQTANVIQVILTIIGILFMCLIIYAGIKWMTASGDNEKVKKARDLIIKSVIGLVIIIVAYSLSYFIVDVILKSAQ